MRYNWNSVAEKMIDLTNYYEKVSGEYIPAKHVKKSILTHIPIRFFAYDDRFDRVVEILSSLITNKYRSDIVRILDLGCGDGVYEKMLDKRLFKYAIFDGLDISKQQIKKAKKYFRKLFCVNLDSQPIPTDDRSYDIIICSELLEHLFYPEKTLSETRRVLKKDGVLLITIPNFAMIQNRISLLLGRCVSVLYPYQKQHIRFFNKQSITKLLNETGFNIHTFEGVGGFFFSKYTFGLTIPTPYILQKIVNKLLPSLATGFLIIAD